MMRSLARPVVRALVRSSLPDRLLETARGLAQWCGIQRAYLVSNKEGIAQERAVHLMPAAHAAGDWWRDRCAFDPSLPEMSIRRTQDGDPRMIPQEVHERWVDELEARCEGRSSWV